MLAVFCHQDFLRSQLFQGVDGLGEVRVWDLHFVDFVKVCLRPVERIVIGRPSNIARFSSTGLTTIRVMKALLPVGRRCC